ncbi:MAG: hypothetical protein IJL38_00435 [Bacteroidales bacterium]|nr:hypothetical protein [Bacteroidales bacterium]
MIKKIIVLSFIIGLAYSVFGQMENDYDFSEPSRARETGYVPYGGVFTPKGDLRILVVFVSYGTPYDSQNVDDWPASSTLPNWATSTTNKVFYSSYSEFPNNVYSDTNRLSISNFYYQMSNGSFKVVADYYPRRVVVNVSSQDDWGDINKKALIQIADSVNWSLYDNRTNSPNYNYDNSNSQPDHIVDYIVFCHRFSWDWTTKPSDSLSYGRANGVSVTNITNYTMGNGYTVNNCGFTFMTGGGKPMCTVPHEIGHELYDAPHYSGNNNVAGNYFYEPAAGWGIMKLNQNYTCAAGWERYILDWTPQIKASGINSDITNASDIPNPFCLFTLRDFITTGDAIRIRVPSESGTHQYLWLENHRSLSTFDGNINGGMFCETPIDEYKPGLVAYVESYSHVKDTDRIELFNNGNGIRWLSRGGDYDFTFDHTAQNPEALCNPQSGIVTYKLYRAAPNPIGGQNINEYIRHDYNNDGHIGYDTDNNSASHQNEQTEVVYVDHEQPTAKYLTGTGMQFIVGDKVGIDRNPCVENIPKYNQTTRKMGDYYLNGISFSVFGQDADGNLIVRVKVNDVSINRDVRWAAGSIVLTNITKNSQPDVVVKPSVTVNIDKSGTPNRHQNPDDPQQTSSSIADFVTPTSFTCRRDSYFKQESYSTVNVSNLSTLVLDSGSVYEINDNAVLNINSTGTLHVKSGATLRVIGAGHVEIKNGAYICIENGAHIELVDSLSTLNLRQGYQCELNPLVSPQQGNCTATPLPNFALVQGSDGSINEFNSNKFIQNHTYYGKAYVPGNNIHAGTMVTLQVPFGDVILEDGSYVILDGENDVYLKKGVTVNLGATLEVR